MVVCRLLENGNNCYQNTYLCRSRKGVALNLRPVPGTTILSSFCTLINPQEVAHVTQDPLANHGLQEWLANHKKRRVLLGSVFMFPVIKQDWGNLVSVFLLFLLSKCRKFTKLWSCNLVRIWSLPTEVRSRSWCGGSYPRRGLNQTGLVSLVYSTSSSLGI